MKRKVVGNIRRRIVKNFLDVLILSELKNGYEISGYDVVTLVKEKFRMLLSPGTVYSVLYSMERNGLLRSRQSHRKKVYTLTKKGQKAIEAILESKEEIQNFTETVFT